MYSKFAQRCLSFLMALVMVLSLIPIQAFAEEAETSASVGTEQTSAESSESVAEQETSFTTEEVQNRIDMLLASFGITAEMTDSEITDAIIAADGNMLKASIDEVEKINLMGQTLTDDQLQLLDIQMLETYDYFCYVTNSLMTPMLLATSATVLDGQISITTDQNTLTDSNGTVTITANGDAGASDDRKTTTITITNTAGATATISFDYTISNYSSFTIAGKSITANDSHSVTLGDDESIILTLKGIKKGWFDSNPGNAVLTLKNFDILVAAENPNVTFEFSSEKGGVTVGGTGIESGAVEEIDSSTGAALVATPNSGVTFLGWINATTGQVLSTAASFTLKPTEDMTVKAVFVTTASDTGWFLTSGTHLFDNLTNANNYAKSAANKKIILANNGTLSGSHEISAGVTLLIPYDAAGTLCTDEPTTDEVDIKGDYVPSVFRTLTMDNGANITVNGAISVSGSQSSAYASNGMPYGPLGFIKMNSGSKITVESDANLYVWGYITGSGSVEIKSGGTVHEHFQIADYRGGDATSSIAGKDDEYHVFPFNQYYIQNVEVPMTLHKGAVEKGRGSVTVKLAGVQALSVPFIGHTPSESMFVIQSGYIVKDYMEGTGRTEVKIYGDLSVSEVNLSMKVSLIGSLDIESSKYALPIPHHFTVSVESGSISMDQTMAFLPGSELYIREGTTCTLGTGKKLYVYDLDQWLYNEGANGYSGTTNQPYMTVKYVPGGDGTTGRLKDALVQVDGTVDVSEGSAYVTSSGANIYSTGTGKVIVGSAPDTTVRQVITNGTDVSSWPEIPIVPAILQNAAGKDPASTNTAETTGTYVYRNGIWCPHTDTDYTDSDKNHKCDTCGTVMSACSDDNKDHKCDICGTVVSSCSDGNKDHKCDSCGMVMSQCSDVTSDGNHTCDICGADGITEHTMLNGVCTDCGAAYEAQIGSTYYETLAKALDQVAEGATVTLLTDITDKITISQQVSIELGNYSANIQAGEGFTYAKNGTVITIGKAVLGIGAVNLRAGDSLDLFFYVKKTALANSGYTDFYAKIERTKGGTVQPAETISYAQWEDYNETYVRFCYDGIAAKEMTDSVTVTVYSADGKPLSSAYTDSVQGYAMRMIRKGSSSAALKTALVDMLNYGAAAQTHFGFNTSSLANALIESEGYSSLATKEAPVCTKITGNPDAFYAGSVSVKNNLTFTFCFSGIDPDKIATATYTDHYGKTKTPSGTFCTLTDENGVTVTNGGQTVYGVDIEDIAIADGRQKITCTVTDVSGNEIQAISSVESYLAYAMENYPDEDVFPMLAKFIDSAYAYFHQ